MRTRTDDHYRRHPGRVPRRGWSLLLRVPHRSRPEPAVVGSDGFRGSAPYGRDPLDEKPLVLPAALRRRHPAAGDQSADLRVQHNHRAGRHRLGRSGGHVKRLVLRKRPGHRSAVWVHHAHRWLPASKRHRYAVLPRREPLHSVATHRHGSSRPGDPDSVAARRRRVVGAERLLRPLPDALGDAVRPFRPDGDLHGSVPRSRTRSPRRGSHVPDVTDRGKRRIHRRRRSPPQRMCRPETARAITSRWISLVPSKMV